MEKDGERCTVLTLVKRKRSGFINIKVGRSIWLDWCDPEGRNPREGDKALREKTSPSPPGTAALRVVT